MPESIGLARQRNKNANHPKRGSSIRVAPITDLKAIKRIKRNLRAKPRDHCLFTMGINTAYRANELLSLTVGQVNYLVPGDVLVIRQSKTKTYRPVTVNGAVVRALDTWLAVHPRAFDDEAPLFPSRKGHGALTVSSFTAMVKDWCAEAGLSGNYGTHTLRKTWGYHQLRVKKSAIPFLMEAYGHATQRQTLDYLCIQADEVQALYLGLEL